MYANRTRSNRPTKHRAPAHSNSWSHQEPDAYVAKIVMLIFAAPSAVLIATSIVLQYA
jgi:hypothetical protein